MPGTAPRTRKEYIKEGETAMSRKRLKAQSTVEYMILMAAVVGVLLFFAKKGGVFQNALNATMNESLNYMVDTANMIFSF